MEEIVSLVVDHDKTAVRFVALGLRKAKQVRVAGATLTDAKDDTRYFLSRLAVLSRTVVR